MDGLARRRESAEASFERRTTNAMLEMFNDLHKEPSCFIIGATNHPWDLDSAFLSRFERKVHLGLPSKDECKVSPDTAVEISISLTAIYRIRRANHHSRS